MTLVEIKADKSNVEDFRNLVGDDHFERALLDAAINHLETALRSVYGESLLKLQFTSRGYVAWSYPSGFPALTARWGG